MNYLCGDHNYLQNLQSQLPGNLVSGSVFFTRVHEVKLQVFPQTFFFHLRIKMRHCISATQDQLLNKQNILFIRKFPKNAFCSCSLPILTSKILSPTSDLLFSLEIRKLFRALYLLPFHIVFHLVENGCSQKIC